MTFETVRECGMRTSMLSLFSPQCVATMRRTITVKELECGITKRKRRNGVLTLHTHTQQSKFIVLFLVVGVGVLFVNELSETNKQTHIRVPYSSKQITRGSLSFITTASHFSH